MEKETSRIGLLYSETKAFEVIAELLEIEHEFDYYDESKELNVFIVKLPKGKSGILFNIGKMIEAKFVRKQKN